MRRLDSPNAEYVLSGNEDNIVAYRIVHMADDSPKTNQTIHTTSSTINNSVTTSVPQQLQYIVFDGSNGFLQAVPTTQITAAVSSAPIKVEPQSPNMTTPNPLKMRTSVAIAPKIDYSPSTPYSTTTNSSTSNKSNVKKCLNLLLDVHYFEFDEFLFHFVIIYLVNN